MARRYRERHSRQRHGVSAERRGRSSEYHRLPEAAFRQMSRENTVLKKILIAVGAAAVAAVGGSLIHPFGTPGISGCGHTILREAQIDSETLAIIERGCQNCHSQKTEWPWYSHVAPLSWLLARA